MVVVVVAVDVLFGFVFVGFPLSLKITIDSLNASVSFIMTEVHDV